MKLNHGLSATTILKKIIKKKLLKTTNLRTKHRGNSLTEPSVGKQWGNKENKEKKLCEEEEGHGSALERERV